MSHRIKRLLIIDDNKTFVMYIGLLLRRMGFEVTAAENALEGLKTLKTDPPDGVLLDVVMPDMNGTDILRHIRGDKKLAQLPVIMVSVDGNDATMNRCRQLGAS
ncbi:MAG: response regulator, partial [Desulfuromonadales bacterium]|nr:response regulator [Desulfuromonadales bacterium]NIS42886.1 response regulator [Desulfuromonadales bacterium]